MKKLRLFALLLLASASFSACCDDYDDSLLKNQIVQITDQVKALQALTAALESRDYVTSITPTTVEGVAGYIIAFAKSPSITILNGGSGSGLITGVDTSNEDYVVFTLSDGKTITLPRNGELFVGFDKYEVFMGSAAGNTIALKLPATLKQADYTAITATVSNANGTATDIVTRSAATDEVWGVEVAKPTFGSDGVLVAGSAKVVLTAPKNIDLAQTAMLRVTLTDKKGREYTAVRPVKYFDGVVVEIEAGGLNAAVSDASVKKLAVKGSINAADFTYIRESLTALEVLDLSMTDMTVMPNRGLAFYDPRPANTTLSRVILPETVTAIEEAAFANCLALESIDIKNAQSIGKWAFEKCNNLREVCLGNKLQTIGHSAFLSCTALNALDIPASVETLGSWLFENCENLENITLHEGLHTLSESTFYGCGVRSIRIPSTVTEIPGWAFQDCKKLERITLHDGITDIGDGAFLRCYALKSMKIPAGVTVIRTNAFDECKNLQTVILHDDITEIQERAFAYCGRLESEDPITGIFKLPASLAVLGESAFINCSSLQTVDMSATAVTAISKNVLSDCKKLSTLLLPAGTKTIGEWAFGNTALFSIVLPASVMQIGDFAFWQCSQLKQIYSWPATAPTLGNKAFDPDFKTGRRLSVTPASAAAYEAWRGYFDTISAALQ